ALRRIAAPATFRRRNAGVRNVSDRKSRQRFPSNPYFQLSPSPDMTGRTSLRCLRGGGGQPEYDLGNELPRVHAHLALGGGIGAPGNLEQSVEIGHAVARNAIPYACLPRPPDTCTL